MILEHVHYDPTKKLEEVAALVAAGFARGHYVKLHGGNEEERRAIWYAASVLRASQLERSQALERFTKGARA